MQPVVTSVLRCYGIEPERIEPLPGGLINPTFKIWVGGKPVCILQQLNRVVFPEPVAIMENILQVLPLLSGPGYQATELLKTTDGTYWLSDSQLGFWRAYRYILNSRTYSNSHDNETAAEAGRIVGTFHQLLRNLSPQKLQTTLPGFHDLERRTGELALATEKASPDRKSEAQPWLVLAASLAESCWQIPLADFPTRACHNDPVMKNILFREDRPEALCLIDLDTLMPGYLIWDFGDAARSVVTAVAEDYRGAEPISPDLGAYAAFSRGFIESGVEMSDSERQWLPWGLVLMPFLHGIRALADFLAGDVYYKTEYPGQNLVRAKNLLTLASACRDQIAALGSRQSPA